MTTVILHRPEVRNAVDGITARALEDAFHEFEQDESAKVAVFYGDGDVFLFGPIQLASGNCSFCLNGMPIVLFRCTSIFGHVFEW